MSSRATTITWEYSSHGGAELLALVCLSLWCNDYGEGEFKTKTLAKRIRKEIRATQRILEKCKESGELEIELDKKSGHNSYRIRTGPPELWTEEAIEKDRTDWRQKRRTPPQGGTSDSTQGASKTTSTGVKNDAHPNNKTVLGDSKEKQPSDARHAPLKTFVEAEYERTMKEPLPSNTSSWVAFAKMLKDYRGETYTLEYFQQSWTRFLTHPDKFHRSQANPLRYWASRPHVFSRNLETVLHDAQQRPSRADILDQATRNLLGFDEVDESPSGDHSHA